MAVSASERSADEILRDAEPISRDSLTNESVVKSLWERADEIDGIQQSLFGVGALAQEAYTTDGNIFLSDVAAALYHFEFADVPERRVSRDMLDRIDH